MIANVLFLVENLVIAKMGGGKEVSELQDPRQREWSSLL